jgi:hypothetical protein
VARGCLLLSLGSGQGPAWGRAPRIALPFPSLCKHFDFSHDWRWLCCRSLLLLQPQLWPGHVCSFCALVKPAWHAPLLDVHCGEQCSS